MEVRCPLIVEEVEYLPDSGGPGRWRGGLGTRTVFRMLADAHVTTRGDRLRNGPPGRDGGRPGVTGRFLRRAADGTVTRLASKVNNEPFLAGEAFIVETTGGGGIGAPEDRPVAEVLADVAAHRVTAQAAERDYGVVLQAERHRRRAGHRRSCAIADVGGSEAVMDLTFSADGRGVP